MEQYRHLHETEIQELARNGCSAQDWASVQVCEAFLAGNFRNVQFSGNVKLGASGKMILSAGNLPRRCGIYNSAIHNCTIGDNMYISNAGCIANYKIEDDVIIEHVGTVAVECATSFGNGTKVAVMNEAGGREVVIYNNLSAQIAMMAASFRHRPKLINEINRMSQEYVAAVAGDTGTIGQGTRITGTQIIKNVNVGEAAVIEGADALSNGTVDSSAADPAYVGPGVVMKNFIMCSGAKVTEHSNVHDCFIGQAAELKNFAAEQCLVFANSQLYHGEACAAFAGPYTVSHHKSSLLIAGMFSFFNAGSGANQSNHKYKLGPLHQGVMERGCKMGSDSYLLWPARIGAFSTVTGKHYVHVDTSTMPFSYLLGTEKGSTLVPGSAIKSVGTVRDIQKWPNRDKRKDTRKLDGLIFDALSPYTAQNLINGRNQLDNLRVGAKAGAAKVDWNGLTIEMPAIGKGIEYYDLAITCYLGQRLTERLAKAAISDLSQMRQVLMSETAAGGGRWMDVAGLIVPEEVMSKLAGDIEAQRVKNLDELQAAFEEIHRNYAHYEWKWVCRGLEDRIASSISKVMPEDIIKVLTEYRSAVEELASMVLADAQKEYSDSVKISYGFDNDTAIRDADFEAVRGRFEDNDFVRQLRSQSASQIMAADEVIGKLKTL